MYDGLNEKEKLLKKRLKLV